MRIRRRLGPNEKDNFGIITPSAINELRDKSSARFNRSHRRDVDFVGRGRHRHHEHHAGERDRAHKEIGLRKSIGARRGDILKQFLAESTLLSLFGGRSVSASRTRWRSWLQF